MARCWSSVPFALLHDAIAKNDIETKQSLVQDLHQDLVSLLVVKGKSEESRKKLESGQLDLSDGLAYKVNQAFIESSLQLADVLNIDELIAAEVLFHASSNELNSLGTSYLDSAIAAYYNIRDYILQIVSYYLCSTALGEAEAIDENENNSLTVISNDRKLLIGEISKHKDYSVDTLLESFLGIEKELIAIKESVERSKLLGTYQENSPEMKTIKYRRDMLFRQYQLLGEIQFGYVSYFSKSENFSVASFLRLLDHVSAFQPEDIFSICYIPSLFVYVSRLDALSDHSVEALHKSFISTISEIEKLSETPLKALIILVFLTHFIDWCKQQPQRTSKFEFTTSVDEPMQKCISVGALEQLLSITADTSIITKSTKHNIKPFYDFRTFLQQHIPRFLPIRMFDIDQDATLRKKQLLQQQKVSGIDTSDSDLLPVYSIPYDIRLGENFIDFLVPVLSNFIHSFISTAAFMMTQLRDTEEDVLLSSDDFNLELLTENADLERLYMSMYYLYSEREQYSKEFWADTNSASYGFLQWASRCNSPLIMSTFSMVLAALASGNENAINVFSFLQMTNSNYSNLMTNPRENSTLLTKYSSISWSTIYSTLSYYNESLSKTSDIAIQNISGESMIMDLKSKLPVVTELGEDSIIYISGFFQVLSQVAINSTKARIELLESDNYQLFTILSNLLNMNTTLNGPILTLLSSLAGDTYTERFKFWQVLDNWLFTNGRNNSFFSLPKERMSKKLNNYQMISGFIDLIAKLFQPLDNSENIFAPYSHPFPLDLGSVVRKPGIWCYIDYLCTEILPEVDSSPITEDEKASLKFSVLSVIEVCLSQLDPDLVLNASACHVKDMDYITENKSIIRFFQSHPGSAVLNSLYNSKVYNSLFEICNLGIDQLDELSGSSVCVKLLQKAVKIVNMALSREKFFVDELIHILRLPDNSFVDPTTIGMSGLRSFFESFLLNLPLIANLSLYIGSTKLEIAKDALDIIHAVTSSKIFSGSENGIQTKLVKKNRLLSLYETIDESIRIRSAFIDQFESPLSSPMSIGVKISLLRFINNNLFVNIRVATVGHFLLGFDTRKMSLGSFDQDTTIASGRSLLKSIVNITKEIVTVFSKSANLDLAPIRLCALCLEILLKLCKSDTTGKDVLKYLRTNGESASPTETSSNFILFLLENSHAINKDVLFSNQSFDGQINTQNEFCSSEGICVLNAFISFRSSLIELAAIEAHVSVLYGSLSLNTKYLEVLTHSSGFASGSSKLMGFLDILDFKTQNMLEKINKVFTGFDYEYALRKVKLFEDLNGNNSGFPYDFTVIDKMISVHAKDMRVLTPGQRKEYSELFQIEAKKLKKLLTCSLSYDNYKLLVFKYLSAWTLLVQVLVTETDMKSNKRSSFILEVFQNIIPKIDEYLEVDPTFAENWVSLCVHLMHTYSNDRKKLLNFSSELQTKATLDFERLFPVLKVALHGIILPTSTPSMRSDLYVLAESFLQQTMQSQEVIAKLTAFLKSLDVNVFNIICHDSLAGESANRITALILLESFVKAILQLQSPQVRESLIFETFCRDNYLLLLAQKLKLTDECFSRAMETNVQSIKSHGITIQELLYELTSFKATVSFLTRVAQTRLGAQQLLRNDIFGIIKECRFLELDADLGFELNLVESMNESNRESITRVTISLDQPLSSNVSLGRNDYNGIGGNVSRDKISYYEIFIPIIQLVTAIVISLGPQNDSCLMQAALLQQHFARLTSAVLKRELLYERNKLRLKESSDSAEIEEGAFSIYNVKGLQELTKLFTLFDSLIN
ncbi:hypothetical protein PMKS-002907 [Pichia membranifaciens]|uniref:Nucleoporin n=1 Tax=Pichia membranifaciens TaxID=4926 RepID=A0A1Q2YIN3_9ASCO|nr:hypothetical protein PMKS-002907 [Pichia membranifaciens]